MPCANSGANSVTYSSAEVTRVDIYEDLVLKVLLSIIIIAHPISFIEKRKDARPSQIYAEVEGRQGAGDWRLIR